MAKLSWKSFTEKHPSPFGFAAVVSSPKGPLFDKNRKKLPTPDGLFQEWASVSLSGDWSSTKLNGGFIICVESKSDVALIERTFSIIGSAKNTPACANTVRLSYKDSDYPNLAKTMGYKL